MKHKTDKDGWPIKDRRYDVIPVLKIGNMVLKIGKEKFKNGRKIIGPVEKSGK